MMKPILSQPHSSQSGNAEVVQTAEGPVPSLKTVAGMKAFGQRVLKGFSGHDVMTLSAALAFYTALSLAPLIVIVLSVVGLLGEHSKDQFVAQVQGLIGPQAATAVTAIIESAQKQPNAGSIAGIIGLITLISSASGVFGQLQSSLNKIWEAEGKAAASGVWSWLRKRLLSMGMVITLGFLALVSLVASTALSFVFSHEGSVWSVVNTLISFAVFTFMFAVILKYLPDVTLSWRDSLKGGAVTGLLFLIGKSLIGLYLGKSAIGSAYGAAGSLLVLLAWVYYSAIIVFTGAEITRILAARAGNKAAQVAEPERTQHNANALRPQTT